jgi:hypothetical protein
MPSTADKNRYGDMRSPAAPFSRVKIDKLLQLPSIKEYLERHCSSQPHDHLNPQTVKVQFYHDHLTIPPFELVVRLPHIHLDDTIMMFV